MRPILFWCAAMLSAAGLFGCGSSSSNGSGVGTGDVTVSGTVATQSGSAATLNTSGDTFRVRATAANGSIHETETDPATGRFMLRLPPNASYVMGFEHRDMQRSMHFAGYMAFGCGASESDHFYVSGRERAIDVGMIRVSNDGSFARPSRNPLDQLDRDGDGVPDARDPDMRCADAGDRDHDGFYDDDMNRDGHHDDDMDGDGHHDCEMGMMGHDGDEECSGGPDMTRTPNATPSAAATPNPHADMTPQS